MNHERIQLVIDAIRKEPTHFKMEEWIDGIVGGSGAKGNAKIQLAELKCGTAGCIGGWMESLAWAAEKKGEFIVPMVTYDGIAEPAAAYKIAAEFIGIDLHDEHGWHTKLGWELYRLFHMERSYSMTRFDRLFSAEERAAAAIRALEIFRDTGKSNWRQALEETGLLERFNSHSY